MRWPCTGGFCDEVSARAGLRAPPRLRARSAVDASCAVANAGGKDMPSDGASVTQAAPDISARASERAFMSRLLRRGASGAFIVSTVGTALGLLANLVMA